MAARPAAALVAALAAAALAAQEPQAAPATDRWAPLERLLGDWEGGGTGLGGRSETSHSYGLVIQDQFVHLRTLSRFEPAAGQETGEIHEDWGLFSYDPDRERIILRQFLSEGYVNTYVLESPAGGGSAGADLVLTTVDTEGAGGMRARITIRFTGPDGYEMVLELAPPGGDWFSCRNISMRRVGRSAGP